MAVEGCAACGGSGRVRVLGSERVSCAACALTEAGALPQSWTHTNVRGESITPEQEEKIFTQLRNLRKQEEYAYKSMSGADVSGAPMYAAQIRAYTRVWEGCDPELAITLADREWRSYAAENNRKIEAAPKTKRGPYSGQSVIHYRYTDPDRFNSTAIHLRAMFRMILGS